MKKTALEEKVNMAWFRATGQSGGWDKWLDLVYKESQEEIARTFKVSLMTSQRWHKEWRTDRGTP